MMKIEQTKRKVDEKDRIIDHLNKENEKLIQK